MFPVLDCYLIHGESQDNICNRREHSAGQSPKRQRYSMIDELRLSQKTLLFSPSHNSVTTHRHKDIKQIDIIQCN